MLISFFLKAHANGRNKCQQLPTLEYIFFTTVLYILKLISYTFIHNFDVIENLVTTFLYRKYVIHVNNYLIFIGMVTTVSMPCHYNGQFIGVVAVDITMSDLLADVTYFSQGQASYAFLVDRTDGRTIMHPLLPVPSSVTKPPIFVDIRSLEPEKGFDSVYSSIER